MIDIIQGKTKDIIYKCCEKYSLKNGIADIQDVQLILGLIAEQQEEGLMVANTYHICNNNNLGGISIDESIVQEYDIMQVLGVKIDFLGYSKLAPPFVLKSLIRLTEKHNVEIEKIRAMCVPVPAKKKDVRIFIYNGNNFIEEITFAELFNEEDVELPQME